MSKIFDSMIEAAREAGEAVLEIYGRDNVSIEIKSDSSPLTLADKEAHRLICNRLRLKHPDIPILSEESEELPYKERSLWETFFLVDPLDGTKEFISRNGEFTINIALINRGNPIAGVVYVPVQDKLYFGDTIANQSFFELDGDRIPLGTRAVSSEKELGIVASRRHGEENLKKFLLEMSKRFLKLNTVNVGSSLKFCLIAEGKADIYPRLAPTSEWDTAAAQAVVEASGGRVFDLSFNTLRYNTKESYLNPYFIVVGDKSFNWPDYLKILASN